MLQVKFRHVNEHSPEVVVAQLLRDNANGRSDMD
jgi:hypothetical protein